MLNIKRFVLNMLEENCYIISDETKEAILIDDGAYYDKEHQAIDKYIADENLTLKHIVCTHAHFDHTWGMYHLYQTYGLKPEIHPNDAEFYANLPLQILSIYGCQLEASSAPVGTLLQEGDTVQFGTHQMQVIHTPGHTPGGICLYCAEEGVLFSGDTLFEMSVGRTDFPGGSMEALLNGLKNKIMLLPADTKVYPGHGNATTIGKEQKYNSFIKLG